MQEIYFDNSATTKVSAAALAAATAALTEQFGNASALHAKGLEAARLLAASRKQVAALLGVPDKEIYFTSGGSEGNNTALFGAAQAYAKQGKKLLVSAVEHPSVLEPAKALAQRGYLVEQVAVDRWGRLDLDDLAARLTDDTILVSCQQVNNETGALQPLRQIGALAKQYGALLHVDGVQGFTKLPTQLADWQADFYTASGHKLHAPKGVGFLWIRSGVRCTPLIYGGGQEKGLRAGTENIPGIAALAAAAQEAQGRGTATMTAVRNRLWQLLNQALPDAVCNSDLAGGSAPHILNVSFPEAKSEVLLHYLEAQGIYVSSGSACHSSKNTASHVLLAMGITPQLADCSLRFSLCADNTLAEAAQAAAAVAEIVTEVRRYRGNNKKSRR